MMVLITFILGKVLIFSISQSYIDKQPVLVQLNIILRGLSVLLKGSPYRGSELSTRGL